MRPRDGRTMNLKGKLVTLRAPEPRDAERLNQWANDTELWQWLGGWHFPYPMRSTERWIEQRAEPDRSYQCWAIDTADHGIVGTVSLEAIDWKNRLAVLNIFLGDTDTRGKGYALDATQALLRFAFEELGMNRIEGQALAFNVRSVGLYKDKLGFTQEGVRRQAFYKAGRFHDSVLLALTREDYLRLVRESPHWSTAKA